MPQIDQLAATYSSQIFWLLVTFGFVFFVIGLGLVPKVQSTVAARDGQIAGDLAAAQAARAAADAAEEDYRKRTDAARGEAMAVTAEAKAKGSAEAERRLAASDAVAARRIAEAEMRIRASADAAMTEIEAVAADTARDLVAKLSGVAVSEAEAARAAKEALKHG